MPKGRKRITMINHEKTQPKVVPQEWGRLIWYMNAEEDSTAEITVGQCVLNPECRNTCHCHPNCQEVLTVLTGRVMHIAGGTSFVLEEGESVLVPAGEPHYARNLLSTEAKLLITYSDGMRQTVQAELPEKM